jgi:hypothetical protein
MLLELPLPAVPAVVDPAPPVVVLGVLELDPALVPAAPLDAVDELEPARALVSMNGPLGRALLAAAPAVPLVPVAPDVPAPPCRQPVTVIVRLALGV